MTETSMIGGCYDGIFDINGVFTIPNPNLINMHYSSNHLISAIDFNPQLHHIKRYSLGNNSIQTLVAKYSSAPSKNRFRRSRTEYGVDCIAGLGIKLWNKELIKLPIETFSSMGQGQNGTPVKIAGSIGNKMMVYMLA